MSQGLPRTIAYNTKPKKNMPKHTKPYKKKVICKMKNIMPNIKKKENGKGKMENKKGKMQNVKGKHKTVVINMTRETRR